MGLNKFIATNLLKLKTKPWLQRSLNINLKKSPWKVLFFGTDDFSIFSLKALTAEYRKGILLDKLEVVTTVKGKPNPVVMFSRKENLPLHRWPPDLKRGQFDIGLVVSFGHLIPSHIIETFEFGMLNVHASLLPRWRGAAPIIYALANDDTETGVTIMRISPKKFDIGDIVLQESLPIEPTMKMGALYSHLGGLGARNLVKTLGSLEQYLSQARPQPAVGVTYAPKVGPNFASIQWDKMTARQIFNLERAVNGLYHVQTTWKGAAVKLVNVVEVDGVSSEEFGPGHVTYDKQKDILKVLCSDLRFIAVGKVGIVGKKLMSAKDFNNGYVKKEPPDCRYFK